MPSVSMEPSIRKGDTFSCSTKVPPRLSHGAVVVFKPPNQWSPESAPGVFTKRVIGLPGETVAITATGVVVDGRPVAEPYAVQDFGPFGPVTVPEGQYFLLGDNRPRSSDSRVNGTVPHDAVVATCTRVVAPKDHRGRIPGT